MHAGPLECNHGGLELADADGRELDEAGFTIIPGPVRNVDMNRFAAAYDEAIEGAAPVDVAIGSSTTRVNDFVNRGAAFDALYVHPPILDAARRIIGEPFKLSTMHARTLRPHSPAQDLHVDFERGAHAWTTAGFIFMVDEFRNDNGATRFVPGSHRWPGVPSDVPADRKAEYVGQVLACGAVGSMIVFNGSVWHGHTVNRSDKARRSIQGTYIRRDDQSFAGLPGRMRPETLSRISPLAKYVLAVGSHMLLSGGSL